MPDINVFKEWKAERRRRRVRGKIHGTAERPRLTVAKSLKNTFVQIIDDDRGVTLVGLATNSKSAQDLFGPEDTKTERARKVGLRIAQLAREKGIEKVVFDRNRYRYHGRIRAVAEGAREGGLQF